MGLSLSFWKGLGEKETYKTNSVELSGLDMSSESVSAVADNSGIASTSTADPNPGDESLTKSKMSETPGDPGKSVQGNAPVVPMRKPKQFKKRIHFNTVIGIIEDMIIGDEFHVIQLKFLEKYWREFVDSEENKHEYMAIFAEYTNLIEGFIESYIRKMIPDFEMEALIAELEYRKDYLDGEVFELLFTLTDFNVFKEMFLDYKMMKEGNIFGVEESLYVSQVQ